ncbi:TPA: fimbria/pilus outer membrane usher protein [Serratia fonticola]|uniref:fimbria/pilus outer membrane usher protein n=1 Tax=Serratia fonticola TaxID=47917 RepID=UPI001378B3E6|nr:fimbria/pilus outer membrane usher protein [Serratia fonticola]NBJ33097.1 fimbria/pilus outer membrane usher protein [Serratia fonticola]
MKIHPLALALSPLLVGSALIAGTSPAWGRDYFDPALLSLGGGLEAVTDLSAFESAGQTPPGTYLVTVLVNRSERGQYRVVFTPGDKGQVSPELTPAFLAEMGVNTPALPAFGGLPVDKPVSDLATLIPDARVHFDFQQQRLELSIPQVAMKPDASSVVNPALWDQGMTAFLLNYTLNGGRSRQDGQWGQSTSEQTNLFLGLHSGLNWQAWRLRSDMTYTHNNSRSGYGDTQRNQQTRFSNTYLQRDIQAWRSDVLVGENNTGNDVFDSIPFRGVKLSSSEDMLPLSLRGFAPVISGIAQSNARVTVSQNGNVVYQAYVAPGPFRINDLYQTGQGGDLTVTVTEADGSVRTWTQAFSALPVMQRPGGLKYELTAGRYNGGITTGSREAHFALGTLIYGLPHDITLYGGGLIAEKYASAVAGSGISLGDFGAMSADVTLSSARMYDERQSGQSYRVRYAKSLLSTGTSVDLTAYRYSTRHYYNFADFNNSGYQLSEGQVPWALARQRSDFQVRVTQQLGDFGSLYLSGARSDYWGDEQVNNTLSAGYTGSWHGVSYGLAYSVDRIKSDGDWPQNRQLAFNMQVPFSLFSAQPALNRSYASYQMTHDSEGRVRQQVGVSGSAAEDRLSYSLMQGWSNNNQSGNGGSTSNLNLGWQGSQGMVSAGYSHSSRYNSLNVSGNGGLVVHPNGVTLSQQLGTSVAVVRAPGAAGVSVMNGGIRTDSRGYAVVPYLSPYQNNTVSLNPSTLPEDVDLPQSSTNVYPTKGAVVAATFTPRTGYQALITLTQSGVTVPFGTLVTLAGEGAEINSGIVGDAGQVYLSGLPEQGKLRAVWGRGAAQQCLAHFNLSKAAVAANNPVRMLNAQCEEGQ